MNYAVGHRVKFVIPRSPSWVEHDTINTIKDAGYTITGTIISIEYNTDEPEYCVGLDKPLMHNGNMLNNCIWMRFEYMELIPTKNQLQLQVPI